MMPSGLRGEVTKRRSGPKSKTSCFLGVTQYKRTGRWEAHIWDSSDSDYKRSDSDHKKGKQLHLGSFPAATPAAIAYDRAAHIIRPRNGSRNFPGTDYSKDEFILKYAHLSKAEFVSKLRIWAQDPVLAVQYSSMGHLADKFFRPPVLTPPIEPPKRQVTQPFASPARQRQTHLEVLLSRRAHPPLRPPTSPLPRPAAKKPRTQRKTKPRPNVQPPMPRQVFREGPLPQLKVEEEAEMEVQHEIQPAPSMVMLLMAMKASDAAHQATAIDAAIGSA